MPNLENKRLNEEEVSARAPVVKSLPVLLTIECTVVCNLRCAMCPQSLGRDRPRHFDENLIESITPYLRNTERIQLHGIGEPMLGPAFWKILHLIPRGSGQKVSVNSNAVLLNKSRINKLVESGLTIINISLDAATSETYSRIRGANFEQVIDNIRELVKSRDSLGQNTPEVLLNMTLMYCNIEEAVSFVELAHRLGVDGVYFWHLNEGEHWVAERDGWIFDYHEQGLRKHPELSDRCLRAALQRARELGVKVHLDPNKRVFFSPEFNDGHTDDATGSNLTVCDCTYPWRWIMITSDGEVAACCFMSRPALGNMYEQSLDEIWNGEVMQDLREHISRGEIHSLCKGAVCKYVRNTSADSTRESVDFKQTYLHWKRRLRIRLRHFRMKISPIKLPGASRATRPPED